MADTKTNFESFHSNIIFNGLGEEKIIDTVSFHKTGNFLNYRRSFRASIYKKAAILDT